MSNDKSDMQFVEEIPTLSIKENGEVSLNKIKLKFLATKKDNYNNENCFYAVENGDFAEIVANIPKDFKVPWFKGKKGEVLKIKSRWLKDNKKATVGGVGDISMKEYDFEGVKGYYVDGIAFE